MGQIKNIKLHIVTDIKTYIPQNSCEDGCIQIPARTVQEETERSLTFLVPYPMLATPPSCRHPPCVPSHPSRQSQEVGLPSQAGLRHLQSSLTTRWPKEACASGSD